MQHAPAVHTSPRTYVTVFAWLAAFTVIEIAIASLPLPHTAKIAGLVFIAIVKAALVVLFYMHLRTDSRWYTLVLFAGLFFALLIGRFLIVMLR